MTTIAPPAELLQRIANNPSATDFANSFEPLRTKVCRYLSDAGFKFADFRNILDFGCGVGRFLFAFQPILQPHQKLSGCDVFEPCATWCQQNINFAEVVRNSIDPPLPYTPGQFDLVYALSVFTHLHLDTQFKWAWEVHRVLKPGGVLFATIHGAAFIPMFYEGFRSRAKSAEFFSFGSDALFTCLSREGEEADEGQVRVASAHTPGFVKEQYSGFEIAKWYPESEMAAGQDLYIFRKPAHGRSIERCSQGKGKVEQTIFRQELSADASQPLTLNFDLNGHDCFRVYPNIQTPGFFKVTCIVEIRSGQTLLASQELPFNRIRSFGHTHHLPIHIHIPPHHGPVTVSLNTRITNRNTPNQPRIPINWSYPNFT